jgi:hypothetical protein
MRYEGNHIFRYHGPSRYDRDIICFLGHGPMRYEGHHIYSYYGPSRYERYLICFIAHGPIRLHRILSYWAHTLVGGIYHFGVIWAHPHFARVCQTGLSASSGIY